jgi:hypothetical protein
MIRIGLLGKAHVALGVGVEVHEIDAALLAGGHGALLVHIQLLGGAVQSQRVYGSGGAAVIDTRPGGRGAYRRRGRIRRRGLAGIAHAGKIEFVPGKAEVLHAVGEIALRGYVLGNVHVFGPAGRGLLAAARQHGRRRQKRRGGKSSGQNSGFLHHSILQMLNIVSGGCILLTRLLHSTTVWHLVSINNS